MKKAIFFSFIIILSFMSCFQLHAFSGGDGSSSNPYLIANVNDLLTVNAYYKYRYFKLVNDIDLSAYVFSTSVITQELGQGTPVIGEHFVGTFDGNGHTIRNLTIVGSKAYYVGLFETCLGSEIKNLTLEDATIIGGQFNDAIGVLIGSPNFSVIRNCHVKNSTISGWNTPPEENTYIGGLIGDNDNTDIEDCSATNVSITAPDNCEYYIGGLVGNLSYSSQARFCYARDCTINGGSYAGGLIGQLTDRSTDANGSSYYSSAGVRDSYSYGVTIYDCPNAGGLVGRRIQYHDEAVYIHRCYSTTLPVGGYGLVGMNSQYGSGNIVSNFWNTDTSYTLVDCGGYGNLSGTTGISNSQMGEQSTFSGWDFSTIWNMDSTDSQIRPMLQSNPEPDYYLVDITSGENGSVSNAGLNWLVEGTELTIEATASSGYAVDRWYVNGTTAQTGGLTYQTGPILSDISIAVDFKTTESFCAVAVSSGSNGFTVPLTGTSYIEQGDELTIHAWPDNGYEVDYWELNGSVYQYGSNTFTLYDTQTNVSSISVHVEFEPILHSVTISSGMPVGNGDVRIGTQGTASPSGYLSVMDKSSVSITATPETGYEVAAWQVNGILCGQGLTTYTLDSVEENLNIHVLFKNSIYAYGYGTADNPYPVYDAGTLNAVGDDLAACYFMTEDIDLNYQQYSSALIGSLESPFLGIFDGNGFTIIGLNIDSGGDQLGLFGVLSSGDGLQGHVKNLSVENPIIDGTGSSAAVLCGTNQSGIIEQCRIRGADVQGDNRVGLLCGYNNSIIRYCSAEGTISGNYRVGLLTGNSYNGAISDSYAIGQIVMSGTDPGSAGGISGDSNNSSITRTFASCSISGRGTHFGSFCGWVQNTAFDSCYTNQDAFTVALGGTGSGNTGSVNETPLNLMQTLEFWAGTDWDFMFSETDGTDDLWRLCPDTVDFPRLWWQFAAGDFVCNDGVNLVDFSVLAQKWLSHSHEAEYDDNVDLDSDGLIGIWDLAIFSESWLMSN